MINQDLEIRLKALDTLGKYPAVTLLMPLNAIETEGNGDPDAVLKELIKEVRQKISELPDSPAFKTISKKLNNLPVKVPPVRFYKGLVAFVSQDHEEVIPLEFSVEKKTHIGQSFLLNDIARLNRRTENGEETEEEKLEKMLGERFLEFKPYGKQTY